MNREVKRFMGEKGYSGYVSQVGIRKDYKRRANWDFKSLEHVLNEYRIWKNKQGTHLPNGGYSETITKESDDG